MPHIEWRGGTCRVKWWTGERLPNGRKRYESQGGFTDEEEALNYGSDREYEVRHGTNVTRRDGSVLMKDWAVTWLEALDLRPDTLRSYRTAINAQIIPHWGATAVGEIDDVSYRTWKKRLIAGYSDNYVSNVTSVFSMIMDDAVTNELRKRSPVQRNGRRGKFKKPRREKKRPLEMAVVHQLAVNAHTVWGYTGWVYIWTAAFTGMRPGEMFGLQRAFASPSWPASDPDAERREESVERYARMAALRVEYQHQYVGGKPTLTEPKYESQRTLVIPPFLAQMHAELLVSHRSPWVFPARSGGHLLGTNFEEDYWHPIRDGAKERTGRYARPEIPAVEAMTGKRIYLLRHGHKEWLDEPGDIPKVAVEGRMGHELAGVEGVYSNVTPGMEMRVQETLQERWERFTGQQGGVWLPPSPTRLPVDGESAGSSQLNA